MSYRGSLILKMIWQDCWWSLNKHRMLRVCCVLLNSRLLVASSLSLISLSLFFSHVIVNVKHVNKILKNYRDSGDWNFLSGYVLGPPRTSKIIFPIYRNIIVMLGVMRNRYQYLSLRFLLDIWDQVVFVLFFFLLLNTHNPSCIPTKPTWLDIYMPVGSVNPIE